MWARNGDSERAWLERIRRWAAARTDCLWLDRVEPYRYSRAAGVVERVRIDPRAGVVETIISDGSFRLGARWHLRAPVEQLRAAPGMGLVLEGIARIDAQGAVLFEEPDFEIVAGPGSD